VPEEKKVAGRLEEEDTGRTNAGGQREEIREKEGEEAYARRRRRGKKGERGKEEGGDAGQPWDSTPKKPLVTWHMCHVTVGLIKNNF
jgi:hypothetical protein